MAKKPDYGRGPQAFLEYVHFIVEHPNYAGMLVLMEYFCQTEVFIYSGFYDLFFFLI